MGHPHAAALRVLNHGMLLVSLLYRNPQGPQHPWGSPGVPPMAVTSLAAPQRAELPRRAALVDNHRARVKSISNTAGETGRGNY